MLDSCDVSEGMAETPSQKNEGRSHKQVGLSPSEVNLRGAKEKKRRAVKMI